MNIQLYRHYFTSKKKTLAVCTNFSKPNSLIRAIWLEKGEEVPFQTDSRWFNTKYRVSEARHDKRRAFQLVKNMT